jgi:hypothetical protein
MTRTVLIVALACALALCLGATEKQTSGHYLKTSVFGAAGSPGASPSFSGNGTLGQSTPPGIGLGTAKALYAGFWQIRHGGAYPTAVDRPPPLRNELSAVRPNPFNPSTTVEYAVSSGGAVSLRIYDLKGELLRNLVDEVQPPGRYAIRWDGTGDDGRALASGLYLCRMEIDGFAAVRKMLMLK